jgi:hypothetical protein
MDNQPEFSSVNRRMFEEASELIHRLDTQQRLDPAFLEGQHEAISSVTDAISLMLKMLLAMQAPFGECRRETPFAEIQPVIDANGNFKWCCTHNPEHCS